MGDVEASARETQHALSKAKRAKVNKKASKGRMQRFDRLKMLWRLTLGVALRFKTNWSILQRPKIDQSWTGTSMRFTTVCLNERATARQGEKNFIFVYLGVSGSAGGAEDFTGVDGSAGGVSLAVAELSTDLHRQKK